MTSHEHNLLPFSTPQSYALLSAESETTQAADNKEMLDECHDIVWCHTIVRKKKEKKCYFAHPPHPPRGRQIYYSTITQAVVPGIVREIGEIPGRGTGGANFFSRLELLSRG